MDGLGELTLAWAWAYSCRAVEDYAIVLVGSVWYRMFRLCLIELFVLHLFACIFFQVKSHDENVAAFYSAQHISDDVSKTVNCSKK